MPKMFVANISFNDHDFQYRIPESSGIRRQQIMRGAQIEIAGPLQPEYVTSIIEQHAHYGMVRADEVDRTRRRISLLYSIDKPVSESQIRRAWERNLELLNQEGVETRKLAAAVIGNELQREDPDSYRQVELVVREEKTDSPSINERMTVTRNERGPGNPTPARGKRRRAA